MNTETIGITTKSARTAIAAPINSARTQTGSAVAPRAGARSIEVVRVSSAGIVILSASGRVKAPGPSLEQVDEQQNHEGRDQHHNRDRGGSLVVKLLKFGHDQQRR